MATHPFILLGDLTVPSFCFPKWPGADLQGHPSVHWPLTFDLYDLAQKVRQTNPPGICMRWHGGKLDCRPAETGLAQSSWALVGQKPLIKETVDIHQEGEIWLPHLLLRFPHLCCFLPAPWAHPHCQKELAPGLEFQWSHGEKMHHEIIWLLQKGLPSAFSLGLFPLHSVLNHYGLVLSLLPGNAVHIKRKKKKKGKPSFKQNRMQDFRR